MEFAGEFKKVWNGERLHIYSTMNETKAAFTERTSRSMKNSLYHYMGEQGYKYIQKLSQFSLPWFSEKIAR